MTLAVKVALNPNTTKQPFFDIISSFAAELQILTKQYQTWPQYISIRSWTSSIVGQIEPEHQELFALEFGKNAETDCLQSSIYKN